MPLPMLGQREEAAGQAGSADSAVIRPRGRGGLGSKKGFVRGQFLPQQHCWMSEFWMNDLVWRHSCPVGWDSVDFPLGADLRGVAEEKRSRHPGSRGFGARRGTKGGPGVCARVRRGKSGRTKAWVAGGLLRA